MFFAVIGAAALWRRDRDLAAMIIATVVYYLLISAGGESESRFRVPVVPQYMIVAAVGVEAVKRVWGREGVVRRVSGVGD